MKLSCLSIYLSRRGGDAALCAEIVTNEHPSPAELAGEGFVVPALDDLTLASLSSRLAGESGEGRGHVTEHRESHRL